MRYLKTFKLFEAAGATGEASATGAETTTKAASQTVPFEFKFDKGMWSAEKNPELEKTLKDQIAPITDYLKKYINNTVSIAVQAGESKVTNFDSEAKERTELEPGVLSSKRGETIRTILRKILNEYKAQKLFTNDPKIDVNYIIGETPYTKGVDKPDDEKYKKEQFVKFVLKVEGEEQKTKPPGGNLIPEGYACDEPGNKFRPKQGSYAGVESNFLSEEYKFTYPEGSGKIVIEANPIEVPDMFIYEYNGKKFSTGFLGYPRPYYLLMLGTIIGNVYKDKEKPWYLKDLTFKKITIDEATKILDEAKGISDGEDLKYAFPDKQLDPTNKKMFRKNEDIIPYMLDEVHVKGKLEKGVSEAAKPNKGYPENYSPSEETARVISLDKEEKVNEFKLSVACPVGQTRWVVKFLC